MNEKELAEREAELARREEELAHREQQLAQKEEARPVETEASPEIELSLKKSGKERLYDRIAIPVRYLDIFIGVCIVAIIVVTVVGALKGNGYLP